MNSTATRTATLTAKAAAATVTALLGAGLLAAPAGAAPSPGPVLGTSDNKAVATCSTKILQGEGTQTCNVTDKDGIVSVSWKGQGDFTYAKNVAGCATATTIKNPIISSGDGVEYLVVTDCKGNKRTITPVLPG